MFFQSLICRPFHPSLPKRGAAQGEVICLHFFFLALQGSDECLTPIFGFGAGLTVLQFTYC